MSKTPIVWCGETHYVEDLFESVQKDVEEYYKRKKPIYEKLFGNKEEAMTDKKGYNDITFGDIDRLQEDVCRFTTQGARLALGILGVEESKVCTLFDRSEDLPLEPPYQNHSHKRLWFKTFIDIPK